MSGQLFKLSGPPRTGKDGLSGGEFWAWPLVLKLYLKVCIPYCLGGADSIPPAMLKVRRTLRATVRREAGSSSAA